MRNFFPLLLLSLPLASVNAQLHSVQTIRTQGHPLSSLLTPDGAYLLVTEANLDGHKNGGIEVFRITGGQLKSERITPLGAGAPAGIRLIPNTHTLALGVSEQGVAFASLDSILAGHPDTKALPQGERAGSGYLDITHDGQYLYIANEYARPFQPGPVGSVGVIALQPAQGTIRPRPVIQAPSGNTTPGLALSPSGDRVYATAEVAGPFAERFPGANNSTLRRSEGCKQAGDRSMPTGGIYVWNTAKLNALPANADIRTIRTALVTFISAGCSPVRIAITADGKRLYTTARGDNKILEFDTQKLERDPEHAFLRALDSGGEAPVGLALFHQEQCLLVANSNRFRGGNGNAAVLDLASGKVLQTFKTGEFPRNITVAPDDKTIYLTNFLAGEVQVFTEQ